MNCSNVSSAVGGSASVTASKTGSNFGHGFSDSASAAAARGLLHLGAVNDASAPTGGGAAANAGFNDSVTITGGTGSGIWVLPFWVDGTLASTGPASLAQIYIDAYENYTQVDSGTADYSWFTSHNS